MNILSKGGTRRQVSSSAGLAGLKFGQVEAPGQGSNLTLRVARSRCWAATAPGWVGSTALKPQHSWVSFLTDSTWQKETGTCLPWLDNTPIQAASFPPRTLPSASKTHRFWRLNKGLEWIQIMHLLPTTDLLLRELITNKCCFNLFCFPKQV